MAIRAGRLSACTQQPLFLSADVGGTYARVALVREPARNEHFPELLAYRRFACRDFPSLSELLKTFLAQNVAGQVRRCVVACAGTVIDDVVVNDTLVWRVNVPQLRAASGFEDFAILNDFEAIGHGLDDTESADDVLVSGPDTHPRGAALIIGSGTGLGAAVRMNQSAWPCVLATEAGQMDFAPGTARERDVQVSLGSATKYVPYERILSGPGLLETYKTLCVLSGEGAMLSTPEAITAAATEGRDPIASETVETFCEVLGSFAGNLAVALLTSGGVYIVGGVTSNLRTHILRGSFVNRFLNKGSMRPFLQRVPVRLIRNERLGVLGAARWYLHDRREDGRTCVA